MKRRLLMVTMTALALFLAACNGGTEENSGETTEESAGNEESAENNEENGEESSDSGSEMTADELIDAAQDAWGGTDSYEMNQIYMIDSGDDSHSIRTITTHSDQNELKVAINHDDATTTHYILDDAHYVYSGNELEQQDESADIEGTSYSSLISRLDNYRSGETENTENGHRLNVQIGNADDASALLPDEADGLLEDADDISGEITLTFNSDHQYTGGEMTAELTSGDETFELSSDVTIENIDNIPVIEKPSGM